MEYIVNGSQAREIDRCSIQEIGIPSMVLMEKAAMSVASCIMAQADKKQDRILVVCGTGNNGGHSQRRVFQNIVLSWMQSLALDYREM